MALIVGLGVALALWLGARWFVESADRYSSESANGQGGGPSIAEGMCLAVLRTTGAPFVRRWRDGALYSSDGRVWWECRWGRAHENLDGLHVIRHRQPVSMERRLMRYPMFTFRP